MIPRVASVTRVVVVVAVVVITAVIILTIIMLIVVSWSVIVISEISSGVVGIASRVVIPAVASPEIVIVVVPGEILLITSGIFPIIPVPVWRRSGSI